jgi:UDP-N-acetylglucosamine--N-acetylmuramyl-(pentapeptide) pyrophosphoryl-undecaprenol N-acetylglucosamine transferase
MKKIILTGGGSGGHIAPIRAVAPELLKTKKLYWMGSSHFEYNAASDLGISFKRIYAGKLRRGFSFSNIVKNIRDVFRVMVAFFQSLFFLLKHKPEKVFSTGGFVSVPVVLAARVLHIPVVIHEQTIGFGLSNKIAATCAEKILLAFSESQAYIKPKYLPNISVVGNPIRENLLGGNKESLKVFLKNDLLEDKPILYITGGGQGSKLINRVIFEHADMLAKKYYVIHQTGIAGIKEAKCISVPDYFCFDFVAGHELADIYACADIVLARSGAGTVNELDHFGIYGIFVPLRPVQNDEQTKNAEWFLKHNNGVIIPQKDFGYAKLVLALEQYRYKGLARERACTCKTSESTEKILKYLL